jgi:hypothetical protein
MRLAATFAQLAFMGKLEREQPAASAQVTCMTVVRRFEFPQVAIMFLQNTVCLLVMLVSTSDTM